MESPDSDPVTEAAAHAANPLADWLKAEFGEAFAAASRIRPVPELFAAGALPPFTASGLDPAELLRVPWWARHAVAVEPDRAAAEVLLAEPDRAGAGHPVNRDFEARMRSWLAAADRAAAEAAFRGGRAAGAA